MSQKLVNLCVAAVTLIMSLALVLVLAYGLNAHEAMSGWTYPMACCSDKDCAEYPSENVKIEGDGFRLQEGDYIPRSEARISPDGHYHICRFAAGAIINTYENEKKHPCFWAPPMGM